LTGSTFLGEPVFPKENVEFSVGEFKVYDYFSPTHGRRLFVQLRPSCGSRFGLKTERFPENQCLFAGVFDDPSSFQPDLQIFTDGTPNWIEFQRSGA
jgi:hypothetical protein